MTFVTISSYQALSISSIIKSRTPNFDKIILAYRNFVSKYYHEQYVPFFFGLMKKRRFPPSDGYYTLHIWDDFCRRANFTDETACIHGLANILQYSITNIVQMLSYWKKESVSLSEQDFFHMRAFERAAFYFDDENTQALLDFFESFDYDIGEFTKPLPK